MWQTKFTLFYFLFILLASGLGAWLWTSFALFFYLLFCAVFLFFTFYYFQEKERRNSDEMVDTIASIYPKNVEKRLETDESNVHKNIKIAINDLLDRIEGAFQLQQTFISNFSHELKNPLMKMVSQLEMAILKERDHAEYQRIIRSVLDDLKELGHLSDTLLELAKVGNNQTEFIPASLRIDELLFDAREYLLTGSRDCRIRIDFAADALTEEDLTVLGNAHLLRTAFVNLMENGCKFSYDGVVHVRCGREENFVVVSIKNKGFGIKPSDIPHLYDPFFRAENTASYKGYGIGLPLVHRIIRHHKGDIRVFSVENEETDFQIVLPMP